MNTCTYTQVLLTCDDYVSLNKNVGQFSNDLPKWGHKNWVEEKHISLTLSQLTNLASSKLKEFADNYFKFDKNGGKCSNRVENSVGKGNVEAISPFPIVFQTLILQTNKNRFAGKV